MSTRSLTRTTFAAARTLQPPPGWRVAWRVVALDTGADGEEIGWNDHDTLEQAIADVRQFRRSKLGARLEAQLVAPELRSG